MDYVQLEFDFTWFQFCDLIDIETGDVVGCSVLECSLVYSANKPFFVVASFECDSFEYAPFFPVCHDSVSFLR